MEHSLLIDIGSSTIKIYEYDKKDLKLLIQRTLDFKSDFDPNKGISVDKEKELFELIDSLKDSHKDSLIKIYATGIFRKLNDKTRKEFIDKFFLRTGLYFNIISQDLENFYLERALIGNCTLDEPLLLINIGGGSTELVVVYNEEAIERYNLDFGVGKILNENPSINEKYSKVKLEELVNNLKQLLPDIQNKTRIAFYSGGELTYMKLAKYKLIENDLFTDKNHPFYIKKENFINRNKEIFEKISLEELENLMPENPKWMHGARPCSALAQAIVEKYNIEIIIPSDVNLINGVINQEFRYVTISGSFRKHLYYILEIKKKLEEKRIKVLSPRFVEPKNPGEEFVIFSGEEGLTPLELERYHLNSIENSDALIICDPEGYVGASALLEIGYAHSLGKRIIFTEKPQEFILNNLPFEIGLLL